MVKAWHVSITDGAVELFHNGSKKLETQSTGIHVTGDVSITGDYLADDNERLKMGNGFDLQIYHDGTDSYIQNTTGTLRINNDGTDLVISTDNNIHIRTNGTEEAVKAIANGAVELYYDNSKKFETFANGIKLYDTQGDLIGEGFDGGFNFTSSVMVNELRLQDNEKIKVGLGEDLQIYHTGSHSYLLNSTGNLYITAKSDEDGIIVRPDGAVELYYDNSKKLETTSSGISVSGKVNIGDTQMSSNLLNIEDGTAAAIDLASHGSGGDTAYIGVKKSTGGGLTFGISNRDIIFKTGATYSNGTTFDSGTERMRIDSSGVLSIGTTSPSGSASKLQVEDSGENNVYFVGNTTTSGARLILQNKNTTANSFTGVLGADGGAQTTSQILFYNADNANNEGYMTFETRPSGGVPTERMRILSGGGITFNGDTAAANALDDYEEGTYTPTLTFASDDGNKVYANRGGSYTKIGRKVTVNININLSNRGTGSGLAKVSLPFTVGDRLANTAFEGGGFAYYFINLLSSVSNIMLQARENTATAELRGVTGSSSGSFSDFSYNFVSNSTELRLTVTYFI